MRGGLARVAVAAVFAAGLALTGCSGNGQQGDRPAGEARSPAGGTSASASAPTLAAEPRVYVAVGASETVGVGADDPATQAWPRVLHDRELPQTRFVDVGVSGATVRDALATQLGSALAADPDVVTVWLAVNDVLALEPVGDYEQQLGTLVHALRRDGRTEVLVGNVPRLDRLPAYRACLPGSNQPDVPCLLPLAPAPAQVRALVRSFNAAIDRVARREGAVVVDLSGYRDLTGLTAADGFHPSTKGHRLVARAFAEALPDG